MYTGSLRAYLLSWLAISVTVYGVDGYQRNLAKTEIESWKTVLIANWLQHEMAQTEAGTYNEHSRCMNVMLKCREFNQPDLCKVKMVDLDRNINEFFKLFLHVAIYIYFSVKQHVYIYALPLITRIILALGIVCRIFPNSVDSYSYKCYFDFFRCYLQPQQV